MAAASMSLWAGTATGAKSYLLTLTRNGAAFCSADGTAWTAAGSFSGYPSDLIYAGGKFAALGASGEAYLSLDKGTSWSPVKSDFDRINRGIAYLDGNFIAVGELGNIIASADGGATWYRQPSGMEQNPHSSENNMYTDLNGVTAGNNCFLAVGAAGLVLQSNTPAVSADTAAHDVAVAKSVLYFGKLKNNADNSAGQITRGMNLMTALSAPVDVPNGSGALDVDISWQSSKPQYIATSGAVTRPAFADGNQVVYLTATFTKGMAVDTKQFIVVVLAYENPDIQDVETVLNALTFNTIKAGNSAADNITSDLDLSYAPANGVHVSWTSDSTAITTGGAVTRPVQGSSDTYVTLTATLTKGSITRTKNFTLTVKAIADPNAQAVAAAKAALTFNTIRLQNPAENQVISWLQLPNSGISSTDISWASSNTAHITTGGAVTRPAAGLPDITVTLTATITKGLASDTKSFTLTVLALPSVPVTGIINGPSNTTAGTPLALTAEILPANATIQTITWSIYSSGSTGATITGNTLYTAAAGTAVVRATVFGGGNYSSNFAADFTVTVNPSGGSHSGNSGGSSPTPKYQADVTDGNSSVKVDVKVNTGGASAELTSSQTAGDRDMAVDMPSISGVTSYSLGIPVPSLSKDSEKGSITLNTDTGSITLPSDMLTGTDAASGSKAQVHMGTVKPSDLPADAREKVDNHPILSLSLSVDGKQTDWNNPSAPVTVSIPYTPTAEELANPDRITVWYIDGKSNLVEMSDARYDPVTKTVVFTTTHFSFYAVGYKSPPPSFRDVLPGAWYYKSITFIAEKGITSGTGNDKFSPQAPLTRGQFLVMVMGAYGIEADTVYTDNFTDAGNTYYTDYLATAKAKGISKGIGQNKFGPNQAITRQEMFTLLYNTLALMNALPTGDTGKTLANFTDSSKVAGWAKEPLTALVKSGTLSGAGGKLNPAEITTRAQMAQVLYNLLGK